MLQVLVERCPRRRVSGDHSDLDLHGSSTYMDKDISRDSVGRTGAIIPLAGRSRRDVGIP